MESLAPSTGGCYICRDSIDSTSWELGGTLNRLVTIHYGDIIRLQYFARWVLLHHLDNECSLCLVKIVDISRTFCNLTIDQSINGALIS